jgi:inner membrane protein
VKRLIYKTHHIAGLIGAELFILHYHVPVIGWQVPAALMAGYIAGPAADIDKEESLVGRKLWPVSWVIHTLGIRHRTVTHSIPFIGLLWYLLSLLPIPPVILWTILAGYASHPFMDLFNEQPVELFWPLRIKVRLLPIGIPVDSPGEGVIRFALSVVSTVFLFALFDRGFSHFPLIGPFVNAVWLQVYSLLPHFLQQFLG